MFKLLVQLVLMFQYISPGLSSCNDPPAINNTEKVIRASPPFAQGSTINYVCLSEYEPYGSGIFTCLNGQWNGSFNCTVRKCPSLKPPDHGRMENTCKEVACVASFFCNEGYQRVGPVSSFCRMNGSWSQAVPECHIMKCPPPPVIQYGNLNFTGGGTHVFGTALSLKCYEGYIRSGFSIMYCDNNGQWTQAPECLLSECSSYPGLEKKCIEKTKLQRLPDGRFLYFIYCTENSIKMNNHPVTCFNGSWDDLSIRCHCSCKVNDSIEGVLYENFNHLVLLKHNETVKWRCKDGYYINATSDLLICKDGEIGTPKCELNTEIESEKSRGSGTFWICLSIGCLSMIAIPAIIIIIRKRRYNSPTSQNRKGKTSGDANKTQPLLSDENKYSREHNCGPDQGEANNFSIEETAGEATEDMSKYENLPCVSILVHQNDRDQRKANKNLVQAKERINQGEMLKVGENNENTMRNDNVMAEAPQKESRGLLASLEQEFEEGGTDTKSSYKRFPQNNRKTELNTPDLSGTHQNDPDQWKANKNPVQEKDGMNQGDILKVII